MNPRQRDEGARTPSHGRALVAVGPSSEGAKAHRSRRGDSWLRAVLQLQLATGRADILPA
jgi:hypothetical protein